MGDFDGPNQPIGNQSGSLGRISQLHRLLSSAWGRSLWRFAPGGVGAWVSWQWPASPATPSLSRCCAAEIHAVLLELLGGQAFLARRSWQEIWWGRLHLDLADGWQLQIAVERGQLGALIWARSPDGRDWEIGCQRDDWGLGPDSRIVDPVALLEPLQQRQLERLLRGAICWPQPEIDVALLAMGPRPVQAAGRRWRRSPRQSSTAPSFKRSTNRSGTGCMPADSGLEQT